MFACLSADQEMDQSPTKSLLKPLTHLAKVEQGVEERLRLAVGEALELVQDEHHRVAVDRGSFHRLHGHLQVAEE